LLKIFLIFIFLNFGCTTFSSGNRFLSSSGKSTMLQDPIFVGSARLNIVQKGSSDSNWFFIAGGPGISSDYFSKLTQNLKVKGNVWHVDFPDQPILELKKPSKIIESWKSSILQIAKVYTKPIFVGHSFGGMISLQTPKLKDYLYGFILLDSSPTNKPSEGLLNYNESAADVAYQNYMNSKTKENLRQLWLSWVKLYFVSPDPGVKLFSESQFYPHADSAFDWFIEQYKFKWVPDIQRSLVIVGDKDKVQSLELYDGISEFDHLKNNAVVIKGAGHFPWVENLEDTVSAINEFSINLLGGSK